MTFPTIPTVAAGRILENRNTVGGTTVQFPSLSDLTKAAGDLLIAIAIHYQGTAGGTEFSSWGAGFTEFFDSGSGTVMSIGCAYKWSTGSETGTFTVATANTTGTHHTACILMAIPGAHASTPPEAGSKADGTTTAAEPASLDPTGWGAEDTLWIAVRGCGETATGGSFTALSTPPPNYGDSFQTGITADLVGGVEGGVAFRQLNAASEDVAAGTCDLSNARNTICVIAVRPVVAAPGEVTLTPPTEGLKLTAPAVSPAAIGAATLTPAVLKPVAVALTPVGQPGAVTLTPATLRLAIPTERKLSVPALAIGASTPDSAAFAVVDGIDTRVFMIPDTWGAVFITNWYAHQGDSSTGAWAATIHPSKHPRLAPRFVGAEAGLEADAAIPFVDGTPGWLQEVVDFDNGSGNRAYSYRTSTDGVTWTALGTDPLIQTGVDTLAGSTDPLEIGSTLWWGGHFYWFEFRDGPNGTVVANPDFRGLALGTTQFDDAAGNTWTIHTHQIPGLGARISPAVEPLGQPGAVTLTPATLSLDPVVVEPWGAGVIDASATPYASSAAATTHVVDLPNTIRTGDLLVMIWTSRTNNAITIPGFTKLIDFAATVHRLAFAYRIADGSEGADVTVTIATSAAQAVARVYRIPTWHGSIVPAMTATPNIGSDANPNPPPLDPAAWGSELATWIAFHGVAGVTSDSVYPLSDNQWSLSSGATSAVSLSACTSRQEVASLDPSAFTMGAAGNWSAATVAILDVAPAAPTVKPAIVPVMPVMVAP